MKKILNLLLAALFCSSLCLPAFAQEEEAPDLPPEESQEEDISLAPLPKEGPVSEYKSQKSPARKKKKAPPVSEYKFSADKGTPAYKFNDEVDPIVKKPPPKKKGKKSKTSKKSKKSNTRTSYKFQAEEGTAAYTFNKKGDPIVKKSKNKKTSGKGAMGAYGKPIPKLKKVKSFDEQNKEEEQAGNPLDGINIPGMPGAGGK